MDGNFLHLLLKISSFKLNLMTIYGPNNDNPNFFKHLQKTIDNNDADYTVVCGDFNLVLNPLIDSKNYKQINNPKARTSVLNLMESYGLIDIFRYLNPNTRRYSWRKKNPLKQARLDFYILSSHMCDIIKSCDIKVGYRSDHSRVDLEILLSNFTRGRGLWKFNNSLLKNKNYVDLINRVIEEETIKYAVPVYDYSFLKNYCNYKDIVFKEESDTFLEMLLMRIRGESIKFATAFKKKTDAKEKQLIEDIEHLERSNLDTKNFDLLTDKKVELEQLRKKKVNGELVRARIQWLSEGEKPSKYFCNLAKKNFIEKTVRNIQLADGTHVIDQQEILKCISQYYQNLFKNKDDGLENLNLFETFGNTHVKVSDNKLGEPITVNELTQTLKKMKNNKTPGIDGITAEFLKVFWGRLKYYIQNAINTSYKKGNLSPSMRQCIITCLPKGDKDRRNLKNWRPISLLSNIYKLMSGVVASRLKNTLDTLISKEQSGFIPGRQISDNTRLVYDLMHTTETEKLQGMLMLIDFEKAFDSISWKFVYNVLEFFGFNSNFINWVKLFNHDIYAYVLQCGTLSEKINIERGCRQGDPISPYLFLLAAEILCLLIKQNENIVGIKIKNTEFKLTQFADDTTLFLDGTKSSLQAALNTLETYGNYSGLKMNKEKTKIIWIGRKKFSKDKLAVSVKLDWGDTEFTLLGLNFSVDLSKMLELNYSTTITKMLKEIKTWKTRKLTPIGKISLIKTNILSKIIHILTSLPAPEKILTNINNILFSFLWDNKPDKIKRKTVCQDYFDGGLKMLNIFSFEKALKVNWIKRLLFQSKTQWTILISEIIGKLNLSNLYKYSGEYISVVDHKLNDFWQNVFSYWKILCKNHLINSNSDILQSCLWYNAQISSEPLYYRTWVKKGIFYVGDLLKPSGEIMNLTEIENTYDLRVNTFLYYRLKILLNRFVQRYKQQDYFNFIQPTYSLQLKTLISSKQGCQKFYKMFMNESKINHLPVYKSKWQNFTSVNDELWKIIFRVCFKSILDNSVAWFQYKILFNILPTRDYLHKIKLSDHNTCAFCHSFPETILHLFCECGVVQELWHNVSQWIARKIGFQIELTNDEKILGYYKTDQNFWPLNFVILITKKYIYWCTCKEMNLDIYFLQKEFSRVFIEQKTLFRINLNQNNFDRKWEQWNGLVQTLVDTHNI